MSEVNVKECLRVWRRKYGEEVTGKSFGQSYWRIPIASRRHLIVLFLTWMRMKGLGKEKFKQSSFRKDLIDICFGTAPAFDEKKRKNGHNALEEELEDILATEGIFEKKRPKLNKNAKPAPTPISRPSRSPQKEVVRPQKEVKKAQEQELEDPESISDSISEVEPLPTEVTIDEEFAKLVGVNHDGWK